MSQELTKRIPVSSQRWKELGQLKQAGQTYDELLADMMVAYNKLTLRESVEKAESGEGNWHSLDEV